MPHQWPVALSLKPPLELEKATAIFAAIAAAGGEAMFVGGAVRDWVLGNPLTDIDIATTLTPEQTLACLRGAGIRNAGLAGFAYGTVAVQESPSSKIEVTTLRRDVATYGRAAKVEFGTDWQEDAARRDFTFNSLYATPNGEIYDPFGGAADLRAGLVRFIGDAEQRIAEDYLRILRFFRFFSGYAKRKPDADALAACAKHKENIKKLSGERIFGELAKLLVTENPISAVELMNESGITPLISEDLSGHQRLFAHIRNGFNRGGIITRLAAWLAATADSKRLAARLKLSNRQARDLRFIHTAEFSPGEWRFTILSAAEDAVAGWAELLLAEGKISRPQFARIIKALPTPRLPLGGNDLRKLGFTPSPRMGETLLRVKKWWAKNDYKPDRKACVGYAKLLARHG